MWKGERVRESVRKLSRVEGARNWLREQFFRGVRHVAAIDESREIFASLLRQKNVLPVPVELQSIDEVIHPYADLGLRPQDTRDKERKSNPAVFITGRFRSGSTLVWNLFRHVAGVTSYYEPFNERRWFDPSARGGRVDQSHLGVTDYWAEYEGLGELGRYFDPQWKFRHLYMPASAWNRPMQRYIETMIARATGRAVLQFNEVDFRLGWLRARFPGVPIIHIYRHPRDQWCSTLLDEARSAAHIRLRDFPRFDGFYLMRWARDLCHVFPFLTLNPDAFAYELYYQIWVLSFLFGRAHSERSFAFEDLIRDPPTGIRNLLDVAGLSGTDASSLVPLVSPVHIGKWRKYADADWFAEIEARVDTDISAYAHGLGVGPRM